MDFYTALLTNGIEINVNMATFLFDKKDLLKEEDQDAAACFLSEPKNILACGFASMNENMDARNPVWLAKQVDTVNKILKQKGRDAEKAEIVAVAIDPRGFESHKKSLHEISKEKDLEERISKIGDDWLIYAVIKIVKKDGARAEVEAVPEKPPPSPAAYSDEDEPVAAPKPPEKKPAKEKKGKEPAQDGAPPPKKKQKA